MANDGSIKLLGGCFCGQVRYEINSALKNARCCHCSRCRKAFSGAGSAYTEVEANSFRWKSGESLLVNFKSNSEWGRSFCGKCGTSICGTHKGEVHGITLGSLDGDPDIQIQMHIFVGSKASWDHIGGTAPQYKEFPTATMPEHS